MTSSGYRCSHCSRPLGGVHLSLDRAVKQHVVSQGPNSQTEVVTAICWAMRLYHDDVCRQGDEKNVFDQLKLTSTYPGGATTVPCNRCAAPVDRRQPYVCYEYLTYQPQEGAMKHGAEVYQVLGIQVLAVLCRNCEGPDIPDDGSQTSVAPIEEQQRSWT